MIYRNLPGAGIKLSLICLGTMMFGGQTSEADSLRIMDAAFERGITFFDTANVYNAGACERVVGKGLKGRRDRIVLATKVRMPMGEGENDYGLSRRSILKELEASLRRLETDYIDIYYLHQPDYDTALEETMYTMDTLVRAGKIRYVGVSNYAAWQIADMLAICEKRGYAPPVITQNVYNLITRGIEAELVPFLRAHDMGMAIYNPIAAGLLAGKHAPGKPMEDTRFANNPMYYDRYWSKENFEAIERLTAIARENGMTILELAMRWCLARDRVTSIIMGVSRLEQLTQNIASIEGDPLTDAVLEACDAVWKGLAGTRFAYNR